MAASHVRAIAAQEKNAHIRKLGGTVKKAGAGKGLTAGKAAESRSAAQVDKDSHIRALGGKVMPRGKLSDAATGRLTKVQGSKPGLGSGKALQKRDWHGRFD